jgi:hypothetical protein
MKDPLTRHAFTGQATVMLPPSVHSAEARCKFSRRQATVRVCWAEFHLPASPAALSSGRVCWQPVTRSPPLSPSSPSSSKTADWQQHLQRQALAAWAHAGGAALRDEERCTPEEEYWREVRLLAHPSSGAFQLCLCVTLLATLGARGATAITEGVGVERQAQAFVEAGMRSVRRHVQAALGGLGGGSDDHDTAAAQAICTVRKKDLPAPHDRAGCDAVAHAQHVQAALVAAVRMDERTEKEQRVMVRAADCLMADAPAVWHAPPPPAPGASPLTRGRVYCPGGADVQQGSRCQNATPMLWCFQAVWCVRQEHSAEERERSRAGDGNCWWCQRRGCMRTCIRTKRETRSCGWLWMPWPVRRSVARWRVRPSWPCSAWIATRVRASKNPSVG